MGVEGTYHSQHSPGINDLNQESGRTDRVFCSSCHGRHFFTYAVCDHHVFANVGTLVSIWRGEKQANFAPEPGSKIVYDR